MTHDTHAGLTNRADRAARSTLAYSSGGPVVARGRRTRGEASRGRSPQPARSDGAANGFFALVYAAVRAIPRGRVATYGEVARIVGVARGARAVGWALRALPAPLQRLVPWHRVVGRGGRISPRAGLGPEIQRRRLRAEGVVFRAGRVDLTRHAMIETPPAGRGNAPPGERRPLRRG